MTISRHPHGLGLLERGRATYDTIATLACRRACITSHDMPIDYGTDREDTAPPSSRGD